MVHSYGGYTTNVSLPDLMAENVLLAYKHDGAELATEHGGPARLLIPHLYLWKSAKWVRGLEFLNRSSPASGRRTATTYMAIPGKRSATRDPGWHP